MMFMPYPIIYKEVWSFGMLIGKILNAIMLFIILTILSMLITYVASIRSKINHLIQENLSLLDRMHEGLLVLSENNMQLRFASKPAIQLLNSDKSDEFKKKVTHSLEQSLKSDNAFNKLIIGDAHMNNPIFIPTKASLNGSTDFDDLNAIEKEDNQEETQ